MKIQQKVTMLVMMVLTTILGLSLAHADDYYSFVDPGTVKPPAPPWKPGGVFYASSTEVQVWLAQLNKYASANKPYIMELDPGCQLEWIVEDARGHYDTPHGGLMESTIAAVTKNEIAGTRQKISILFHPSPDWEVVKLVRSQPGGGGVTMTVHQDSHCATKLTLAEDPDPTPGNYRLTIDEGWFGPLGGGGGGGGLYIDRLEIFDRVDKWIKPFFQPEYGPPWQDELIMDGMDVIGVRFTAPKGEFLETGEKYRMYYTATTKPGLFLDYYAHDASSGRDIYINLLARPVGHPLVGVKKPAVSAGTGGAIEFMLCAGKEYANRPYVLLGSVSGTSPGTPLPGGSAVLPLNWDAFTDLILVNLNTYPFSDFIGKLDTSGMKACKLPIPPVPPTWAGLKVFFAFTFYNPFDLASNHVETMIMP